MSKQKQEEEKKDRKAILLEERKKAIFNLVLLFAAAFVVLIGVLTMAWFAKNSKVNGTNMSVTVDSISFELKSKGSIQMVEAFSAATEYQDGIPDNQESPVYYLTGSGNDAVKWRLETAAEKLSPGACGVLTFWVVPGGRLSSLDMNFTMSVRGFKNVNNAWSEESNQDILKYLSSHILFFENRYGDTTDEYSYGELINYSFTKLNVTEAQPISVYWVWPDTFKQMIYLDGDTNLGGLQGIAHDANTLTSIKTYVSNNKNRLFPEATADLDNKVNACCGNSVDATAVSALDDAYNRGDSVIGSMLNGALIVLEAEPLGGH